MSQEIRVSKNFSKASHGQVLGNAQAVLTGMSGDANFSDSPVTMATLKTNIDNYSASMTAAADGSRTAIAARNKNRNLVEQDLHLLGAYVVRKSNGDKEVFLSSGFKLAAPRKRATAQPLEQPSVSGIDQGKTGELLVTATSVDKGRSYQVRFAPVANGLPGVWTEVGFANVRTSVAVNDLTPGTTYAFQVRELGTLGYTDWSDSATRMYI